ncbi:hypothetical protein ACFE04_027888 [Oxalis oulophora]
MSCLLPQFKCQPYTFSIYFKTKSNSHALSHLTRNRRSTYFRPHCILSTTSTTVLDIEKLRLPSLEAHTNNVSTDRGWGYLGTAVLPTEENFKASLPTETILTSDDAMIAAAASEALALARAAVKVAKEAAVVYNTYNSTKSKPLVSSRTENSSSKHALLTESERASILGDSKPAETTVEDNNSIQLAVDDTEPTNEELEILQEQFSESVAVKSKRITERKDKRARAAKKAASSNVMVKYGSTGRKKRGAAQEVDYSDPLRYIRGTTSSSKLLTAAEELELSAGIQDLLKLERLQQELLDRFGKKPTSVQLAAAAGVDQKTLRHRLSYGVLCKDKMIKSNIRLVISIAKNYQGSGMNLQDLVQEGCRGLVRGAEKFDASKGFKFSTYAHWWIKQAVRKSLSDQSRTIRLPFHMVEATYKVKEARKQLMSENGKQPNDEEIAVAAGLSMKRLNSVLLAPKAPRSLDQKIGLNMNLKPSEVIADPEAETAEDLLTKQFMRQDLEKVLDTLSPREKQVVQMRFGLLDGRMKTLQEIGESMGVSRERIRQIETSAFRKLQSKKRTKNLQQYLLA